MKPPPTDPQRRLAPWARVVVPCLTALLAGAPAGIGGLGQLGTLAAAEGAKADPAPDPGPAASDPITITEFILDAPSPHIGVDGVIHAPAGFVLRSSENQHLISGNALRYDQHRDELYAQGAVVMVLDLATAETATAAEQGLRLHAAELGLRRMTDQGHNRSGKEGGKEGAKQGVTDLGRFPYHGQARDVTIWLTMSNGQSVRFRAAQAEIQPDRFTLHQVRIDGGYGSVFAFQAASVVIGLFPQAREHRQGIPRHVEDITLWQPRLGMNEAPFAIPFFWLPVLYRDYRIDYPWTRYQFGRSRRLGYYVHGQIGSNLPPLALGHRAPEAPGEDPIPLYLRSRLEGRYHYQTKAGEGYGGLLNWDHPALGDGKVVVYHMESERFFPSDTRSYVERSFHRPYAERRATSVDAEHRWSRGALSLYGRYVRIPDADPLESDGGNPPAESRSPSERFRSDYQADYLDVDPGPRRGLAIAYSAPWATATVDSEWKIHPHRDEVERDFGAQLSAPPLNLLGPLHLELSAWGEQLRRDQPARRSAGGQWFESSAQRFSYDPNLRFLQWWGGVGFDSRLGIRGAWERDGSLERLQRSGGAAVTYDRVDVDSQHRWQPYLEAGIRLRLSADWGDPELPWRHVITPRLGVEMANDQRGVSAAEWQDLGLGEDRSQISDEQRLITLGFTTSLHRGSSSLISAEVTSRWSWRDEDRERERTLPDNSVENLRSSTPLIGLSASFDINPSPLISAGGSLDYDFVSREWQDLSARLRLVPHRRVQLTWRSVLVPDSTRPGLGTLQEDWEHQAMAYLIGNRYSVGSGITMRPLGRSIDALNLEITRRFTDGEVGIVAEYSWDETGGNFDRSIGVSFALFGFGGFGQSGRGQQP